MDYRGNPSLPKEIKERIHTTFEQTLTSARAGSYQEAMLGCDFILRLDPDFEPAQRLATRLKEVSGGAEAPQAPPAVPAPTQPAPAPQDPPAAPAPAAAAPAPDLGPRMHALLEARKLEELIQLATANQQAVGADPTLRGYAQTAQERLQAAPHVEKLLRSAEQVLQTRQLFEADKLIEGAESLDPSHPRLAAIQQLRATAAEEEAAAPDAGTAEIPVPDLATLDGATLDGATLDGATLDAASLDALVTEEPAAPSAPEPELEDPFALAEEPASPAPPASREPELEDPFALAEEPAPPAASPAPDLDLEDPFARKEEPAAASAPEPELEDPFALAEEPAEESAPEPVPSFGDSMSEIADAAGAVLGDADLGAGDPSSGPEESEDPFGAAPSDEAGDSRIGDLLAEGQSAFDSGDYQGAIDAWSRIFLIDLDHGEATRRIEQARQLKAEQERQLEEVFHEGLEGIKSGDLDGAKAAFRKVLASQPGHAAAEEYLQQLEAGEVPSLTGIMQSPEAEEEDALAAAVPDELEDAVGAVDELKEEILVPPDPGDRGARPAAPAKPQAKISRRFVTIGAAVLLLVLAGGAYLFLNKDTLFPNSEAPGGAAPQRPPRRSEDPLAQARRLHGEGKREQALRQLKMLAQDNPQYEQAQELIAQWDTEQQPEGPAAEELDPATAARREQLLAEGYAGFEAAEYMRAQSAFEEAAKLAPLDAASVQRLEAAKQELEPLAAQIQLFRDREWATVLRDLWRINVEEPNNRDVVRMIADCYFNLGVRDLQRGNATGAMQNFSEVLELEPDDANAERHFLFAKTYQERQPDLLYRIYVKYLPERAP